MFGLRLARNAGRADVDDFLEEFTAAQLIELYAYDQLEPTLETRLDFLLSRLHETIFNLGVSKDYRKPFSEFYPKWDPDRIEPKKSEEQLEIERIERIKKHGQQLRQLAFSFGVKPEDLKNEVVEEGIL